MLGEESHEDNDNRRVLRWDDLGMTTKASEPPFNPDFIRKMFGPLLLDKRLRRSDGDIHEAV